MEELRQKLGILANKNGAPQICPAFKLITKMKEDDEEVAKLISDSMMNPDVSIAEIHRELSTHGIGISRESISRYKNRICLCSPHCSESLESGKNGE